MLLELIIFLIPIGLIIIVIKALKALFGKKENQLEPKPSNTVLKIVGVIGIIVLIGFSILVIFVLVAIGSCFGSMGY